MVIFRRGLFFCLVFIAPMVFAQEPQFRPSRIESSHAIQAEAWQIVALANQARAEAGAGPLKWDAALATAAREHCLQMAAEGSIAHRYEGEPGLAKRAAQAGAHFSLVEENVAFGPDPAAIHEGWMRSPGHRENLLNPQVDRVGVAVVASRGAIYAVADYERAVPVLSPAQVESRVAALVKSGGVATLHDTAVARTACAMNHGFPHSSSGAKPQFIMRWQDAELNRLPRELAEKLSSGEFRQAAVGCCPAQNQEEAFTAYRLAVLLY
jgi:hypothetical protein